MTEIKRKVGRPPAPPTEVIRIRLPIAVHAKVVQHGGDKWVKRLINEAINLRPEYISASGDGAITDRRCVVIKADGSYECIDPVTRKIYGVSTGKLKQ